jgi:nucleoside-diphosphate-sugar epimerase
MNILVTGSSGYIGTHLMNHVRSAYGGDSIQTCDTKEGEDYATLVAQSFDVVFHLGAISTIMDSFTRADEMMAVNALNLISFFENNDVGKFVFTSTGAIYGNMTHPMKEDEAKWMDCLCPYAQTKYVAEGIIRRMCPNHVIARLGNVFGGDYSPRKEWLAPRHFREDNPIVLYGGEQIRDFVHIDVVCWALVEASLNRNITGTFNIARGEGVRLEEIANQFSIERSVAVKYEKARQGEANYVVLDVTKAKEARLIRKELPPNDYFS